jgi:hypothetical protein
MYAVVVNVTVNDVDAALKDLQEDVVPRAKQTPGFVTGYWTRKDNTGVSMVVFESQEQAEAMAERLPTMMPEHVNLEGVEVREVVAHG